ncbi:predicted protein [Chaetoceros tenuissimus]|uniref:Uncharacterized protein n=1 Tax=Chaetoceros tenuissimus TaxID=426638 RepID=A0AAD3H470_9STRA|nr:predicted protein [Chaetoceros tenuissimus]
MVDEHFPKRKRQRLAVLKNEAKDIQMKFSGGGVLSLPTGVLVNEENNHLSKKVVTAVFQNDRVDLFQDVLLKLFPNSPNRPLEGDFTDVTNAVRYKSTEIMRSIIANEQIIHLLRSKEPPEYMKREIKTEDIKNLVQAMVAACDPDMIHQLVEKGVVFHFASVFHSLRRKDLETFKCLLDMIEHDGMNNNSKLCFRAIDHEMHLDAIKYLKQKGYFDDEIVFSRAIIYILHNRAAAGIDIMKCILEGRHDISEFSFGIIIGTCISCECTDILSYIHESVKRINIDRWLIFAESEQLPEVVAHLQSMR